MPPNYQLAPKHTNAAVGDVLVSRQAATTFFDFGEWSSEVASRKNPDGTISFITIVPGFNGLEFVIGENTLTLRDAQHEYVYGSKRGFVRCEVMGALTPVAQEAANSTTSRTVGKLSWCANRAADLTLRRRTSLKMEVISQQLTTLRVVVFGGLQIF
jgi:hypothetical protein